jgi:DNA-binding NarL/FixJ family response regulator
VTRVYLASAMPLERSALRLMLLDLNMEVAGEGDEWSTTLAQTPICCPDILMMDWGMFPAAPNTALDDLRKACPKALVIILISTLMDRQQAALLAGVDVFISKSDLPERVAEHLRIAAAKISASSNYLLNPDQNDSYVA